MQLVIPIEDTSSGSTNGNHCTGPQPEQLETDNQTVSAALERNANNDAILSMELRDQFETMKSIWRQARRDSEESGSASSADSSETKERRARVREDLKRKERETAVETAIKVQNEIATWQNGIADLEALLAAEEERTSSSEDYSHQGQGVRQAEGENGPPGVREIAFVRRNNHAPRRHQGYARPPPRPAQIRFPFLPPAIPTEEESDAEEEDQFTQSTSSSSRFWNDI